MQFLVVVGICLAAAPVLALPNPGVKIVLEFPEEKLQALTRRPTAEVLERYGAHITGGCEGVAWCKHYDFCYYGICYDLPWWTMLEVDQSIAASSNAIYPCYNDSDLGEIYCKAGEACYSGACCTFPASLKTEQTERECFYDSDCGWREYCGAGVCYFAGYGYPDNEPDDGPEGEEPEGDDCGPEFGDDCPCLTQKDCHPEDTCVDGWCFSSAFLGSLSTLKKEQYLLPSKTSFPMNSKQRPLPPSTASCDYHTDCSDDLICYAQACTLFSFTSDKHLSVKKIVKEYDNRCYVDYGCSGVSGAKVCGYYLLCDGIEVGAVNVENVEL
ncbi:hypothetical protein BDZ45DRAFT_742684 [Acephala macrosclerotiorum]|nr:hypothetical protein BDZ45DRAFT_742684 [Acephala macrosclerotiorum]